MVTSGRIRLSKIKEMLDECAPGYSFKKKTHKNRVGYKGKTYHLSQGPHGKADPEIEKGHIKQMIRHLNIDMDCAKKHLPALK